MTKGFMINADDADDNDIQDNDRLLEDTLQPNMLEKDGDMLRAWVAGKRLICGISIKKKGSSIKIME